MIRRNASSALALAPGVTGIPTARDFRMRARQAVTGGPWWDYASYDPCTSAIQAA